LRFRGPKKKTQKGPKNPGEDVNLLWGGRQTKKKFGWGEIVWGRWKGKEWHITLRVPAKREAAPKTSMAKGGGNSTENKGGGGETVV